MSKKIKYWLGAVVAIIGFISSVTGIISWLGVSFHLGDIIVPNPIIIILAIVLAVILWVAAFVLGGMYVIYMLFSGLMKAIKELSKQPTIHIIKPNTSPAQEPEQKQEQIMKQ